MTAPAWDLFAGIAGFVTLAIVVLARLSAGLVTGGDGANSDGSEADAEPGSVRDDAGTVTDVETGIHADAVTDTETGTDGDAVIDADAVTDGETDAGVEAAPDDEAVAGDTASGAAGTAPPTAAEDSRPAADDPPPTEAVRPPSDDPRPTPDESPPAVGESMSPGALVANVALSQGLFGSLLVLGAWYARVPASALGLGPESTTGPLLALGVGLGVALYAGDELLAAVADRAGVGYSEALRDLLAPESRLGWTVLLGVALPVVAGFEELLFRGVLVGALSAGFGVSPWLLAVASSLLFGVAHGAQGRAGMVVTGALGFALAAAFVLTGSLAVVVVAHYLVNALEFAVHERLDVEWTPGS